MKSGTINEKSSILAGNSIISGGILDAVVFAEFLGLGGDLVGERDPTGTLSPSIGLKSNH
jgi:hypothetical protein